MSLYFIGKPRYDVVCCEYIHDNSRSRTPSDILKIDKAIKDSKKDIKDFMKKRNYAFKVNTSIKRRRTRVRNNAYSVEIILVICFDRKEHYSNLKLQWEPYYIDIH